MAISIINYQDQDITSYTEIIQKLFSLIGEKRELAAIFVTPDYIQNLNKTYKNRDYVTDVLSFPTNGEIENDLGDIFICLDKAILQAKEYGHSLMREVLFLLVHGYLHLLGYDHEDKQSELVMMQKTEEILSLVNLDRR